MDNKLKKRPHQIELSVSGDFAHIIANEIWKDIRAKFDLIARTDVTGFSSDMTQTLRIKLFCTDEVFRKVELYIYQNYEFNLETENA